MSDIIYYSKEEIPKNIREYLETVSRQSFDTLELNDINDFLSTVEHHMKGSRNAK